MKKQLLAGALVAALAAGSLAGATESRWQPAAEAQAGWWIAKRINASSAVNAALQGSGAAVGGLIGYTVTTKTLVLMGVKAGAKLGMVGGVVGIAIGAGLGAL